MHDNKAGERSTAEFSSLTGLQRDLSPEQARSRKIRALSFGPKNRFFPMELFGASDVYVW